MGEKPYFTQKRLEECTDENDEFSKCPECGQESDTSRGVSMHYGYKHEGSIGYLFRCEECGRLKFGHGQKNTFCSKWCEIYNKVGTFKHFDEDYLRRKIVEDGFRAVDIAEKLDVRKKTVHKWVRKYEIGDEYPCPSCEKSFASKQGVSKHHDEKHGESIKGSTYTCKHCGDENWTPKSENNHKYPEYCDDDCWGASMSGENNPNKSEERREKISRGLIQAYAEGRKKAGYRNPTEVEETGHTVDSTWEKEVDLLLHRSDIEYEYNGRSEYKRYEIDDFTHAPDFIIPIEEHDIIIEVKGGGVMYFQEDKMRKIGKELTSRNDTTYIVYGDVDLECDYHIEYGAEEELLDLVKGL